MENKSGGQIKDEDNPDNNDFKRRLFKCFFPFFKRFWSLSDQHGPQTLCQIPDRVTGSDASTNTDGRGQDQQQSHHDTGKIDG